MAAMTSKVLPSGECSQSVARHICSTLQQFLIYSTFVLVCIYVVQVELEKKLLIATKEKAQYRRQLEKALSKIAEMQKKEKSAAKAQLLREKRELDHMRLRYLAAEEKKVITTERKELDVLKNELSELVVLY